MEAQPHQVEFVKDQRNVGSTWLVALAVTVVQLLLFWAVSRFRFIDGDEGFYLIAARKVAEGSVAYRDFFYPQMPFLPSVYGTWMRFVGDGWFDGRMLSCIFAALTGTLVFEHLRRSIGSIWWALLGVLLFACSGLTLTWHTTVKTFSLSTLLLTGSWVLLEQARSHRGYGLSGLLLGLSISTRLFFAPLAPVLAFVAWRRTAGDRDRSKSGSAWLIGVTVGLTPSWILLLASTDAFIYNNILYHADRSGAGLIAAWPQKISVLMQLFGLGHLQHLGTLQLTMLWVVMIFAAVRARFAFALLPSSFVILVALVATSLLPTPTWYQYFAVLTPFLADSGVRALRSIHSFSWSKPILVVGVVGYLTFSGFEIDRITRTGKSLPMVDGSHPLSMWRIEEVQKVGEELDRVTQEGEVVLTWWPGYFVGGHASPVPGLENHFALLASPEMSFEKRRAYHIVNPTEASSLIEARRVRTVLLGIFVHKERLVPRLLTHGYERILEIPEAGVELWQTALPPRISIPPPSRGEERN
jgi:hypothetical protein